MSYHPPPLWEVILPSDGHLHFVRSPSPAQAALTAIRRDPRNPVARTIILCSVQLANRKHRPFTVACSYRPTLSPFTTGWIASYFATDP